MTTGRSSFAELRQLVLKFVRDCAADTLRQRLMPISGRFFSVSYLQRDHYRIWTEADGIDSTSLGLLASCLSCPAESRVFCHIGVPIRMT